jgi:hypothetical protein
MKSHGRYTSNHIKYTVNVAAKMSKLFIVSGGKSAKKPGHALETLSGCHLIAYINKGGNKWRQTVFSLSLSSKTSWLSGKHAAHINGPHEQPQQAKNIYLREVVINDKLK